MAIQASIDTPSGATATYHTLDSVQVNPDAVTATVHVVSFVDASAQKAGKNCLDSKEYTVDMSTYDGSDIMQWCHDQLIAMTPFADGSPKLVDATSVASLSEARAAKGQQQLGGVQQAQVKP